MRPRELAGIAVSSPSSTCRPTAPHHGLPASSEIQVGYAEAAAQTAPPATTTEATTTTATVPEPPYDPARRRMRLGSARNRTVRRRPARSSFTPAQAGPYVFPVYGPSSYIDTFGASRTDVTYHHGDDIFGELGQPLLAVADGTVFSVGWKKVGGNRLWLLDPQGNQFYYAHLSAFSPAAVNGAHVKAGEVIGFMGNTGDAEGTPYHLHFEVHPVSFLYLGYDGAVDPTPYLEPGSTSRTCRSRSPPAGRRRPRRPGRARAGAILLGMNDISTADGLDPGSLERALTPVRRSADADSRADRSRADDRSRARLAGSPELRYY